MPDLAIDTATETLSIALGGGGEVIGETEIAAGRSHLELLLPAVDRLLASHRVSLSDLEAICVGIGPGTFSGLRVGVATARGIAQGLGLPITGSGSLEALAGGLAALPETRGSHILPVIDAKRGQVFSRLFLPDDAGELRPRSEIMCLEPDELVAAVSRRVSGPVFAGGDGAELYARIFSERGMAMPGPGDPAHRIKARYHLPVDRPATGFSLERAASVVPLYVREPDADKTVLLRKKEPWLR